jgi:2-keto-4-pentenoate hydratase
VPDQDVYQAIASRLDEAWEKRLTMTPFSETGEIPDAEFAYRVQTEWTRMRVARGDRVMGRKIGLTSIPMQQQIGVDEPDYGTLWTSRYHPARRGRAEFPPELFIQPRAEGELAFLIGKPLGGGGIVAQDVLAATEAVAVSVEVIDSRIDDWRIKLVDTVADNASYGALTLGPWSSALAREDLRTIGMMVHHNGVPVVKALGADAWGHPAAAVAWLANKLSALGVGLEPGDVVLSGSLGRSIPAKPGDVFLFETFGRPPLSVVFG